MSRPVEGNGRSVRGPWPVTRQPLSAAGRSAVGLAPLAAGSRRGGNRRISAIGTGWIRRRGKGDHVTGVVTARRTSADIEAGDTGPIVSDGDGDATTGVRLD